MKEKLSNIRALESNIKYLPFTQQLFFCFTLRENYPHSLNIEATNLCNLNCVMCPRKKSNRKQGLIDFSLFKKIINQLEKSKKKLWVLTLIKDGEPLLHPKLDKMIDYASAQKVARRLEIFTNGILLNTNDWSRRLLTCGLDILNVSIDAALPSTYQKIRRSNEFDRVVKNVRNLMKLKRRLGLKKPRVIVRCVGLKENIKELSQIKKMWQGIADGVEITPFANYGGGVSDKLGVGISEKRRRWPCLVLWYNPVINWDGMVTTCCANYLDNELIMGDIKKQDLKSIWQSEKFRQLRSDHLKGNLSKWPACAKCTYWRKFANMKRFLKLI